MTAEATAKAQRIASAAKFQIQNHHFQTNLKFQKNKKCLELHRGLLFGNFNFEFGAYSVSIAPDPRTIIEAMVTWDPSGDF